MQSWRGQKHNFPQMPMAAVVEKYMSPTAQLDSLDVPMRKKTVACRLTLIDSFQLAAEILPSLSVTYDPNFN